MYPRELIQQGTVGSSWPQATPAIPVTGSFPVSVFREVAMSMGTTPADSPELRPDMIEARVEPIHRETVNRLRRMQRK